MFDIPLFLQKGKARELNDELINQEVFAFLKTDASVEVVEKTNSPFYAFSLYVVKLYILYHDYGCKFLYCLTDNNQAMQQHIEEVCALRSKITHGFFYGSANANISASEVQRIVSESNDLYMYMQGETYSKMNFLNNDKFIASFDSRLCATVFDQVKRSNYRYAFIFNGSTGNVKRMKAELQTRIRQNGYIVTPNNILGTLTTVIDEIVNPQPQTSTSIINSILRH